MAGTVQRPNVGSLTAAATAGGELTLAAASVGLLRSSTSRGGCSRNFGEVRLKTHFARHLTRERRKWQALVLCCSSKGTDGENQNQDYVQARVVDAVSMLPLHGHLFMTLANGKEVEVDHINPTKGRLLYRSRNPAIFLKVIDDSDILLPIIVGETAIAMLMRALHDEEKQGRPNHYQLLNQIVEKLEYQVRMVRITERVKDTYYARIYFGKIGIKDLVSVDARPSDAINFAVRCEVPIYVNKAIVDNDAVKPVYTGTENWESICKTTNSFPSSSASYLDSPHDGPDPIAEEITLMKTMLMAVVEERYSDAARYRDQLNELRISLRRQMKQ